MQADSLPAEPPGVPFVHGRCPKICCEPKTALKHKVCLKNKAVTNGIKDKNACIISYTLVLVDVQIVYL